MFGAFTIYLSGLFETFGRSRQRQFTLFVRLDLFMNEYVHLLTQGTSVEYAVLQCGPGTICVHITKTMRPCVAETTSGCGLSGQISVRPQCVLGLFTPVLGAVQLCADPPKTHVNAGYDQDLT